MIAWRRVPTAASRYATSCPLAASDREGAHCDGVLRGLRIVDGLRDSPVDSVLDREWPAVRQNLNYLLARNA